MRVIKVFFDNINHEILIKILSERIKDERFLRLIRKFLKAGHLEEWRFHNTYSGTPQGGIISPILANIYLDKLDKFMDKLQSEFNCGKNRKPHKETYELGQHRTMEQKSAIPNNSTMAEYSIAKFRSHGALNQAAKQGLSAKIRFAKANMKLIFEVCFSRPR